MRKAVESTFSTKTELRPPANSSPSRRVRQMDILSGHWGPMMTLETFLLWVAVGAIAGFLASLVVGTGFGLLGDIIIGVVGAFIGGWVFRALGWHTPFAGIAGTVVIAFLGAVLLMLVLRGLRRRRA